MKFRQVNIYLLRILFLIITGTMVISCATKKKKGEVSKLGKFYHNVTSEYNGYFNANELIKESTLTLRQNNIDNYSNLLDVYDYVSVSDPKMVYGQLDKAIEKVTRVAAIHEPGNWVDDCYVLMGKAQFLKQDYETSVETFEFFQDEFNPANPFGRNYKKRKPNRANSKAASKQRQEELKEDRKAKEEERKATQEARADDKKAQQKLKEEEQKARKKATEDKKKEAEDKRKARAKGKRVPKTTAPVLKQDSTSVKPVIPSKTPVKKDPVVESKIEDVADNKPITPKKEKADDSAYNEGMLWLARAYTRSEQYSSAEYILNRINELDGLKKPVKIGWAPAMADLMIQQKKYNEALEYLEMAVKSADRKEDKARYSFIAGQISGINGAYADAGKYFDQAKKKSGKDFKLRFMSELNQLKNNALSGSKSLHSVENDLEKMLAQDKNKDYKDQIYYALGEIEFNRQNTPKALEYFTASVQSNSNDPVLKAEAYFKIANMYYDTKKYVEAKAYFDSTAMNMVAKDPRTTKVNDLSKKLTGVAEALSTLTKLDTLMAMSKLDKDQLYAIAKERKLKEVAGNQPANSDANTPLYTGKTNRSISINSSFFAYNPLNLESGKRDFKKAWGDRPLEDNWRRSKKSFGSSAVATDENETPVVEEVSMKIDEKEFERLMADVPMEQTQKIRYNNQIADALYKLGSKLKLDLSDYPESNKYLERLIAEFPNDSKRIEALYLLYTNYTDQSDAINAKRIKDIILTNYPETNYAKIIENPSYADQLISESMRVENYYDDTYKMFEGRNYTAVVERAGQAGSLFGADNKFMPKFSLINAMSLGFMEGKEAYIKALQETIVRHPGTPEETKAKEIMRFLKGDEASFNTVNVKEVDNIFTKEDDSRHYVAIVLYNYSDKVLQEAKIAISNYNSQFFKLDRLQIGDQILSKEEGTQVIIVRSFENMAKAKKYYDTVKSDQEKFISSSISGYDVLPISLRNFRKMVSEQSHAAYRTYYETNYK